jgi:hypothetical protein
MQTFSNGVDGQVQVAAPSATGATSFKFPSAGEYWFAW